MEIIARGQITIWNYKDGDDAYSVILNHDTHAVACDPSGNALGGELGPSGKAVFALSAYRGATKLTMRYSSAASTAGICTWKFGTISGCTAVQVSGSNEKFYINTMIADSAYVEIVCSVDGKASITKRVTIVKQKKGDTGDPGEPGDDGKQGCMLRPRGTWTAQTQYVYNDQYRDVVIHNNSVYIVKTTHTSAVSFDSSKWELFNEFINVATSVLLANKGYIDVLGAARLFVGDTNKSTGWEMTNGYIRHTKSGLTLTADGKLYDPDGLHLSVGGKTVQAIVDGAVDGIQVGGRNILKNSDFSKDISWWYMNNSTYQVKKDSVYGTYLEFKHAGIGNTSGNRISQLPFYTGGGHQIGKTYSLSFYAKAAKTVTIKAGEVNNLNSFTVTTQWQRYSVTYVAKNTGSLTFNVAEANVLLSITQVKLEESTKPSDWSPAPEDLSTKIEENSSKIEQLPDQISLTVDQKIENIQVGGRNYIQNSTFMHDFDKWSKFNYNGQYSIGLYNGKYSLLIERTGYSGSTRHGVSQIINTNLKAGEYTLSLKYRSNQFDGTRNQIFVRIYSTASAFVDKGIITIPNTQGGDSDGQITFNVDSNIYKAELYVLLDKNGYLRVWEIKLEQGNKATDWSPAPEDIDNSLSTLSSEIKQTADSISLKVAGWQGGTNLLPRSKFSESVKGWNVNGSPTYGITTAKNAKCLYLSGSVDGAGIWQKGYMPIQYKVKGYQFAVSFDVHNPSKVETLRIGLEGSSPSDLSVNIKDKGNDGWTRVAKTVTYDNVSNDSFVIYTDKKDCPTIYIKNVKIEFGPYATNFTENEKDVLLSTGIDIFDRKLVLTADNTMLQSNDGQQIAMFTVKNGKPLLKAENIDAENLKVNYLEADTADPRQTLYVSGNTGRIGFSLMKSTNEGIGLRYAEMKLGLLDKYDDEKWIGSYINLLGYKKSNTHIMKGYNVFLNNKELVFADVAYSNYSRLSPTQLIIGQSAGGPRSYVIGQQGIQISHLKSIYYKGHNGTITLGQKMYNIVDGLICERIDTPMYEEIPEDQYTNDKN